MRLSNVCLVCFSCILLTACGTRPIKPSDKHIQRETGGEATTSANIPQPIKNTIPLPPPTAAPKAETYSVVVTNVPAQEILFALARDAKINLDVHAGIQGAVTLNAINQTLPQILDRIAKQVDMRYTLDNGNLLVEPDKAFLKTYKIDFINMSRSVESKIFTSSQITNTAGSGSAEAGGNSASTSITSKTDNDLMVSLIKNIENILVDEDKLKFNEQVEMENSNQVVAQGTGTAASSTTLGSGSNVNKGVQVQVGTKSPGPGGSVSGSGDQSVQGRGAVVAKKGIYVQAVNVFANKETGVLSVRATSKQHEKVQEFIDRVMNTAMRQVMIEATIVEVRLSDQYQQGINWSALRLGAKGFQLTQAGTPALPAANTGSMFILNYANPNSPEGNLSAQVALLESFGTVKVLSSPKLSVMNNQTATLKVADNKVYFTIKADTTTNQTSAITTFTTTPNSITVGFVMNVTPQISDTDTVTMNVRPTISRIIGFVNDPNPSLKIAGVTNAVPEIQTREMESIIKISSGQIAVMGGLMQDEINNLTDAIPGASNIPLLGNLFKNRNDTSTKTELVIFLRPVVIKDASVNGDYSEFRDSLPDANFFKETNKNLEPSKDQNSSKP